MILVVSSLIKRKKKNVDGRKCWKNKKILNRSAMYLERKDDCLKPAPTELDNVIFLTVIVHPDRKHMKKENFCSMAS